MPTPSISARRTPPEQSHIAVSISRDNMIRFKFSSSKTVCMHFCRLRSAHPNPELTLNGTVIPVVNKPNSSESFLTISSHSFHTSVTSKRSVWRRWAFCVLLLILPGEPTSTRCYIFIDRLFALSSTMAVSSMVPRENLIYVYWIRYRTMHCGYATVPSGPHLPQVCVFKPMNLHSTYGEECWVYSIPSDLAHPRAIQLTIRSSTQNSKLPSPQNLIRSQHWASALHQNLKRLVLSAILYLGYLFQPLLHGC